MKKETKNKILMGLLCVSLLSGCEMTTKECDCKDQCNTELKEEVKKELSKDEAYKLVKRYTDMPENNVFDSGLTEETMIRAAINNTKRKYILNIHASNLKGLQGITEKTDGYTIKMNAKEYVIEKESYSDGYSYEGVNEAYQNLFGKTLDKKDFSTNVPYSYKYISNLDCYVELVSPTSYFTTLSYGVKDVKEEDNKVTITVGYAIFELAEEEGYRKSNIDPNTKFKIDDILTEGFGQTMVEKYSDKVNDVEFVFEEKDNDYVLVSVTKK